ncbi:MAG TPA: transporter substrate-binding domain-containing protein [Kiloniellaceae bacterium]
MTGWMKTLALAAGIAMLATTALTGSASADTIDDIKKRGKLIVGVKADYAPYGFLDSSGKIVGLEPDLAQDVADVLGVELELVPVVSSNRMQFLEQGKIDLMIATMTDTAERRGVVDIIDPNHYSSGTNILTKGNFTKWEDLKGAPVCGIQGAFYNRKTSEEFGAEIVAFKGTAEALTALKQNRCVAFVYDDAFIVSRLAEAEWKDWKMPLPTIDDAPWGVAVKKGEPAFAALMSGMVVNWHLSGRIIELEKKYGLQPTPFAQKMHEMLLGVNPSIER